MGVVIHPAPLAQRRTEPLPRTAMLKFLHSFGHAAHGVAAFFRSERNARVHLLAAVAVLIAGWTLRIDRWEWAAMGLAIGPVFAAELLNTAVERLCDVVMPERDPRIKTIKDLAAAGVLMAALSALAVGLLVLGPRILVALC